MILESDEPPAVDGITDTSDVRQTFSIGGLLGRLVNRIAVFFLNIFAIQVRILSAIFLVLGRVLGSVFYLVFYKPAALISSFDSSLFVYLARLAVVGLVVYLV